MMSHVVVLIMLATAELLLGYILAVAIQEADLVGILLSIVGITVATVGVIFEFKAALK